MSLDMCARIRKRCMDEGALKELLSDYFSPSGEIAMKENKSSVSYDHIYESDKVIVYFSSEKKPPYNVYDSDILNGEFEYEQLIIFDISKEDATAALYKEIVDFCIFVREQVDSDILVTSDVHGEVCLLEKRAAIWASDISWT